MATKKAPPNRAESPMDRSIPLSEASIGETLQAQAVRTPNRSALVEWVPDEIDSGSVGELRSLTYAELNAKANEIAAGLLANAVPGDRVAIWAPNSINWVVLEYAVALSGLVLVPLNPSLTSSEAADLIDRSGCVAIFATSEFRGRNLLTEALQIATKNPCLSSVLEVGAATSAARPRDVEKFEPQAQAPFLIQYTSGTTGKPKGAVLSRATALNIGVMTLPVLDVGDGAVWVNPLPLHHVGASVCGVFSALACGGTFVTVPSFDPRTVLHLVERTGATVLGAVPTTLMAMLDLPELAQTDVSSLRVVQVGGSTVATSLIRRAETTLGVRIVNAYGQSEAPSVSQTRLEDDDDLKATTIGRAGLHRQLRIADPVDATPLRHGEIGELQIRTPLMMSGYFDDAEHTAETIDTEGWLRTGDLCSMDAAGYVTIHGRLRDLIIRGGENVYPAEVEDALLTHPAVAEVAVVGAPDDRWGERVVAFVRLKPGAQLEWRDLDTHAEGLLARFKCPREWHAVEEFPLTSSGKIQKFRLREQLQQELATAEGTTPGQHA